MQAADKKATNDGKLIKIDTQNLITYANTTANREQHHPIVFNVRDSNYSLTRLKHNTAYVMNENELNQNSHRLIQRNNKQSFTLNNNEIHI